MTSVPHIRDAVEQLAARNALIVTARDIRQLGFHESSLRQYARRHDDLLPLGHGVYQYFGLEEAQPQAYHDAEAVAALAIAGDNSYLAGSAVLNFYDLAYANPDQIRVKTQRRNRRQMPSWIQLEHVTRPEPTDQVRQVRLQKLPSALLEANDIRKDYRLEAVEVAKSQGLLESRLAAHLLSQLESR
ncbi:hypothetical protein KIM372_01180 [Bombiscardovia nodaiensis]|uniref:Transcriptional regulator, AbiEi antitoxin, Type IV TA system n=1 Tax=Bombiscardovia nodaiensis TaxID=2932181 RepID=A0ABN6S7K4_9BIFI|nr:hypothetical protein KIM372_01180 [Bombiscardovia nodaiensis]